MCRSNSARANRWAGVKVASGAAVFISFFLSLGCHSFGSAAVVVGLVD
jgi:hypothetical protein